MSTPPLGPDPDRTYDDESPDAAPIGGGTGLDITPRTHSDGPSPATGRKVAAIAAIVVLVAALGVVVFNGLNDAALFYYNVDEALERRTELEDQRFRMQGNVIDGSIEESADGVEFVLSFDEAEVEVHHRGDPPELFSADIPVIIEGSFAGEVFESDEILIRHDNTYTEEHEERLDEANRDVEQRTRASG